MNCPVTCGRPTRMSAEAFARMCEARRDDGGGRCAACGGWPESWPAELTIIELGGNRMGKKNDKQDTERAGVELAAAAWSALMDRCKDAGFGDFASADPNVLAQQFMQAATEPARELDAAKKRIADLEAELSEARGIIAHQAGEVSASRRAMDVDLSAAIYRDALADFAIRVLSGGVAVSFHEARP